MKGVVRRNAKPSMLIPIILALLWLGPSVAMKYIWIDVQRVEVTGGVDAFAARVDVDRHTILGFPGEYSVEVRRVADDMLICAPHSGVIDYRGGKSNQIRNMPLSWWMQGFPPLESCIRNGFRDGLFYLRTCHDVMLFREVTFARRCTISNIFQIGP